MNSFYKSFKGKTNEDLRDLASDCDQMSLDSKLALQKLIQERNVEGFYSQELVDKLNKCNEEDINEIRSLKYLNWLGIDLYKEENAKIIRKSKSSKGS